MCSLGPPLPETIGLDGNNFVYPGQRIVGFHMMSLKFKIENYPTETLLS